MPVVCSQKPTSTLHSAASRWGRPLHRRELRHEMHPGCELRAAGGEVAEAAFARNIKSHSQNQLGHARRPLHQWIDHSSLKYVGHALRAGYLMRQCGGRTLTFRSRHLPYPYADPFAHIARLELKPLVSPIRLASGIVETRLAIQAVK